MDVSAQGFAVDEFHGDERAAVLLADVVDGANAGMVESGCGARFATEAIESLRFLRQFFGEEFQGDRDGPGGYRGLCRRCPFRRRRVSRRCDSARWSDQSCGRQGFG